jgi:hypothetical protein
MQNPLRDRPGVPASLLAIALAAIPVQAQALSQIGTSVFASSQSGGVVGSDEIFPLGDVTVSHTSGGSQASARYENQVIGVEASSSWAAFALNASAGALLILDDTFTVARPAGSSEFGVNLAFSIGVTGSLSESNGFAGWRVEGMFSAPAYRDATFTIVQPEVVVFARDTTLIDPFPGGDTPLPAFLTSATNRPGTTSYFLYDSPIDLRWLVRVNAGLGGNSSLPGSAAAALGSSAYWLGITATDSQGAIIENLQITSESGTNWMNAAAVPEPALLWLWLPAAGALALSRCRRLG